MEGFNEQVVKRVNTAKNTIIKIVSILALITVPTICVLLAYVITPYMIYLGLFLLLGGIYVVWYIFTSQKVEYEYSVIGDELDIAKVVSLRRRKRVCKVQIREITQLEKGEKSIKNMHFTKTFIAAHDIENNEENYYAVFNSTAYGKCVLIFSPNEHILEGMKKHLNKDIMIKLFYRRG